MVTLHCEYTKCHWTVPLKWVNCMVYKLYLNNAVSKSGTGKPPWSKTIEVSCRFPPQKIPPSCMDSGLQIFPFALPHLHLIGLFFRYLSVRYVLSTAENMYNLMNEWLLGFDIKVTEFKQMSQCLEKYWSHCIPSLKPFLPSSTSLMQRTSLWKQRGCIIC